MTNQLVLVGRITDIQDEKAENGRNTAIVTIAVNRIFKNADGIYETDFSATRY